MVLNYQLYLYSRERQFLPQHYLINYSFSFRGRDSLNFLPSYLSMNMIFLYLPCSCLDSHVVQASWVTLPCHLQEIHSYNSFLFFFFFYKFLYLVSMFSEPYVQGLFNRFINRDQKLHNHLFSAFWPVVFYTGLSVLKNERQELYLICDYKDKYLE